MQMSFDWFNNFAKFKFHNVRFYNIMNDIN